MGNTICDPSKAKFWPEMLIEGLNQASITTDPATVASYLFKDRSVVIENPTVESTANLDFVVSADSNEKYRIRSNVPTFTDVARMSKVTARKSLTVQMQMAAGNASNVWSRFNLTVRRPTVVDKCRYNDVLSNDKSAGLSEIEVAEALGIDDLLSIGYIPNTMSLLKIDPSKMFEDIIPVDKSVTAIGASSIGYIGSQIPVSENKVAVLLGMMVDSSVFTGAGVGPGDTYLCMDRGDLQPYYQKIDITSCADGLYMPCFIPVLDNFKVYIESATGSGGAAIPAGFIYGVRDRTIIDYEHWGIPYSSPVVRSEALDILNKNQKIALPLKAGII
jgi:hypothetical protein